MKNLTNTEKTFEFIEKAKEVHGCKFSYDKVDYVKSSEKVIITCNRCGKEFLQTPNKHLLGRGCKVCSNKYRKSPDTKGLTKPKLNTEDFIKRARKKHGNKYDYSLVEYTGIHNNIKIKCNICGKISEQSPANHLRNKGCKYCSSNKVQRLEEFTTKAVKVHGDKYSYDDTVYTGSKNKISIYCNTCKKSFKQEAQAHLQGSGCTTCGGNGGFDNTKPAILYYLSVLSGTYYKIGITNLSVEKRFCNDDLEIISTLKTWDYPIGYDAKEAESRILDMYKQYRYKGENILKSKGNTELFTIDVLELDNKT